MNENIQKPDTMIEETQKFADILRDLYNKSKSELHLNITFEEIMSSNLSRINFINSLFDYIEKGNLNAEFSQQFIKNIEFIKTFITAKNINSSIPIDRKYFDYSLDDNKTIIPNKRDLMLWMHFLKFNVEQFNLYFNNNIMVLRLPDGTLNQNMYKIFTIYKRNLAHILGITETKGNDLVNYFVEYDRLNNPELYDYNNETKRYELKNENLATRIIDWIVSEDGEKEILRLYQEVKEFIKIDKKEPGADVVYDKEGNIINIDEFKKRAAKKNIKLYLLDFSRLYVKTINTFNFLGMNNITEMISDYNHPSTKGIPKNENQKKRKEKLESQQIDTFLVSTNQKKLEEIKQDYEKEKEEYFKDLKEYSITDDPQRIKEIKEKFSKKNIDLNMDKYKFIISNYRNLVKTSYFSGEKLLERAEKELLIIVSEALKEDFLPQLPLFGFRGIFNEIIPTDEESIIISRCVSSIALDAINLTEEYYKNGRRFFVDSIFMGVGSGEQKSNYFRISNVEEEIAYLLSINPQTEENLTKIEELKRAKKKLLLKFKKFILQTTDRKRKKPKQ